MLTKSSAGERRSTNRHRARVKIKTRQVTPEEFDGLLPHLSKPEPVIPELVHADQPDRAFWVASRDLSAGGMGVCVEFDALHPGKDFIFDLDLPGLKPQVRAVGQIIWECTESDGNCRVGVMFTAMSDFDKERLRKFLEGR